MAANWTVSRHSQTEFQTPAVERVSTRRQAAVVDVHRRQTDGARVVQSPIVSREFVHGADTAAGRVVLVYGVEEATERAKHRQAAVKVGLGRDSHAPADEAGHENHAGPRRSDEQKPCGDVQQFNQDVATDADANHAENGLQQPHVNLLRFNVK